MYQRWTWDPLSLQHLNLFPVFMIIKIWNKTFSLSLNLHFPDDWWYWFLKCICLPFVCYLLRNSDHLHVVFIRLSQRLFCCRDFRVACLVINYQPPERWKVCRHFLTFCVLSLYCIDCFCFIQPHALNSWTSVQPFELFSGSSVLTLLAPPNCRWLIHMLSNELFFHRHGLLILAVHSFCLSQPSLLSV